MPVTTASLGDFLTEKVAPTIKTQLPNEVKLLKRFDEADDVQWSGRECVQRITVNRNRGVYFTAEGGQPPVGGNMQYEAFRIPMRYVHGGIRYTKQSELASKNQPGPSMLKQELKGMMDALKRQHSFAIMGDGRGVRALINGDPGTGTTLTLDSPGGFAGANHGNRYLNEGDYIVAINPATGLLRAGGTRYITARNAAGTTVTVSAAIDAAWADNDIICKAYGSDASINIRDTDWQHPHMGIMGMIDNGTYVNQYFGLSRTTFPILQATRFGTTSAPVGALSADVMQRAIDVVSQVSGGTTNEIWCHLDTRRAYLTIMEQDRRYQAGDLMRPNAGTVAASGKDSLKFGPDITIHTDGDFPYGFMIGLDTSECQKYTLLDGEWANDTGSIWRAVSGQVDTLEATWRSYVNYGYFQPNKSWRLDGISNSFVVAHIA